MDDKVSKEIIVVHESVFHSIGKDLFSFGCLWAVIILGWLTGQVFVTVIGIILWFIWMIIKSQTSKFAHICYGKDEAHEYINSI